MTMNDQSRIRISAESTRIVEPIDQRRNRMIHPRMIIIPVLLMLMICPVSAVMPKFIIENKTASQGSEITVPIIFTGTTTLGATDLLIVYDPDVLHFERLDPKGLSKDGIMEANETAHGILALGIADPSGIQGGTTIATIKFRVTGTNGASTPLYVQADNAVGLDLSPFEVDVVSGTFTVESSGSGSSGGKLPLPAVLAVIALGSAYGIIRRWRQ